MALLRDYFIGVGGDNQARMWRMLDRLEQAIGTLETADANWATLNAAQKDTANHLAVTMVAKIGRLLVSRLEAE
jgi:hypothetical protein